MVSFTTLHQLLDLMDNLKRLRDSVALNEEGAEDAATPLSTRATIAAYMRTVFPDARPPRSAGHADDDEDAAHADDACAAGPMEDAEAPTVTSSEQQLWAAIHDALGAVVLSCVHLHVSALLWCMYPLLALCSTAQAGGAGPRIILACPEAARWLITRVNDAYSFVSSRRHRACHSSSVRTVNEAAV